MCSALFFSLWIAFNASGPSIIKRITAGFIMFFGFMTGIWITTYGIVLRDGLGPDSIRSYGHEAIHRSIDVVAFAAIVCFVFVTAGIVILKRNNKKAI